jgi:glutaredoxin
MKQYGHELQHDSGKDWVQEALEESLDLAIYISAKLVEIKKPKKKIVKIYSKNGCNYCTMAKDFLKERQIEFEEIDMTDKDTTELTTQTSQKTFPFIFNGDVFIGGYTDLLDEFDF